MKNLSKAIALVGAMTASTAAFAEGHEGHAVEVAASAGVATSYLFRGEELVAGSPMVYGDVMASLGGAYGGIWVAGGDDGLGTEYDLILGYGGEAGDFSYDVNLVNFVYTNQPGGADDQDAFDVTELTLGLGYGDFGVSYTKDLEGADYELITLSAAYEDFGLTLGAVDRMDGENNQEYTYVDFSYAANDNITLIASQKLSNEENGEDIDGNEDIIFVVDVALPL